MPADEDGTSRSAVACSSAGDSAAGKHDRQRRRADLEAVAVGQALRGVDPFAR